MTHLPSAGAGFPPEIPSAGTLQALNSVMLQCTRCPLAEGRIQVVPGSGSPTASLMFIGEAPGAREDEIGIPFVGRSGALLDEMLASIGIERADVFIANVVRCRPPANRDPRPPEVRACHGWLVEQLRLIQPSVVATLGRFALQHLIPGASVTRLQGTLIQPEPDGFPFRLFPLLHPAAILRNANRKPDYQQQFRELAALL